MKRLLVALLLLIAAAAHAETITLAEYTETLTAARAALNTNRIADAHAFATQLVGTEIAAPRFAADDALLRDIIKAKQRDLQLDARLAATLGELSRISPAPSETADAKLLEQLAKQQQAPKLPQGGYVPGAPISQASWLERVAAAIGRFWTWLSDLIEKILDWIFDFLPHAQKKPGATSGMRWIVGIVVALIVIVIAVLAFEVIRRSRRATKKGVETSEPLGSTRDEDPLSRGSNEWERYAAQLAAAGRIREAIRAWYHAVLVTLYTAGILHFRKGRTNWEYVAALAPSLGWRAGFIQLTRRFEREWYGADESTREALDECSDLARGILATVRKTSRGAA